MAYAPGPAARRAAARHRALERAVERRDYFATPIGYQAYIRRLHGLYQWLEPALARAGVGEVVPDWPLRLKVPALTEDLAVCCGGWEPGAHSDVCEPTYPVVRTTGPGSALGVLYVLEGSTLGGALLARRAVRLGFTPVHGARFLNIYGRARSRMWRGFLSTLEATPLTSGEDADLVHAARTTFSLFYQYLGKGWTAE